MALRWVTRKNLVTRSAFPKETYRNGVAVNPETYVRSLMLYPAELRAQRRDFRADSTRSMTVVRARWGENWVR